MCKVWFIVFVISEETVGRDYVMEDMRNQEVVYTTVGSVVKALVVLTVQLRYSCGRCLGCVVLW